MTRILWALLLFAGCGPDTRSTLGQKGKARFAYIAAPGCEDGCNLEERLVAGDGAKQQIRVRGPSFATVESAAPSVASFAVSADGVEATTAAPGDTDLVLRDAAGGEVNRVAVHVAETRRLQFDPAWAATGVVAIEGVALDGFSVKKVDAGERVLFGAEAVRFSTTGTLTSLGRPAQVGAASIIESIRFQGAPGKGTIEGVNAGASLSVPVTVVRVEELNRISGAVTNTVLGAGGFGQAFAEVSASTPDGSAYGIACAWTVSDPSVEIADDLPPLTLDAKPVETLKFRMAKAGKFSATCKLGRLDVTLNFERI